MVRVVGDPARFEIDPEDSLRRWFSVAVWAMIGVLLLFSPAAFVVLGWFTEAYRDTEASSPVSHRLHEVAFGVLFSLALAAAIALKVTRKPRPAALAQLTVVILGLVVVVTATEGWQPGLLLYVVPLGAVVVLARPDRPVGSGRLFWWPIALLLVIAIPMTGEIASHVARATSAAQNHTTHWSAMGALAVSILVLGLIPALRIAGYRLVMWCLAAASIIYGAASMAFPFDASSHRRGYSISLTVWGCGWLVGLALDRLPTPPGRLATTIGLAIGIPLMLVYSLLFSEFDKPPNVPHLPDPAVPALTAADVDRATCVGCHGIGRDGAPTPPHALDETCFGDCWDGRSDCAGCHRIDPRPGTVAQIAVPEVEAETAHHDPDGQATPLEPGQVDLLLRMAEG